MAPEQARGKQVDKRADIWAFGVVLYEMILGKPAFAGEDVTEILASVVKEKPDLTTLPAQVRPLIERCLEKDPRKRLRDLGDLDLLLAQPPAPPAAARPRPVWGWIAAAGVTINAAAAIWALLHPAPAPLHTVTRSAMTVTATQYSPALSRDGTRLVYVDGGRPSRLWLRMMDQLEGHPIPGAEGVAPVFSPDGQWVAYVKVPAPYQLKKILVTGGTAITLCDLPAALPLYWGDDDAILFGSGQGLMRVPAAGGRPETLAALDAKSGETGHYRPQLLPGGQAILYTTGIGPLDASRIALLDVKTRASRVLVNAGWAGRYAPSGHVVFRRGGALLAVPFDLKRLAVTGSETPVVEGLAGYRLGSPQFDFSDSGLLVYQAGTGTDPGVRALVWMDRKGVAQPLPEPPHNWGGPRLSPDGKTALGVIFSDEGTASFGRIWTYDIERRILTPLTSNGDDYAPIFSPDGRWVVFGSDRGGKHGIYRIAVDSSSQPELLLITDQRATPWSLTPDGKTLLYYTIPHNTIWCVALPAAGGDGKPRRFHPESTAQETQPQLSPDGKWLAYTSGQSGRYEIYVSPFPGPGGNFRVSTQGGRLPFWSHNGHELFYVELNPRRLMSVEIVPGAAFHAGPPQPLFTIREDAASVAIDITSDGKRFLITTPLEGTAAGGAPNFVFVTDWFTDLLRRAPVKR
jgi:serine/threonine-protein kinase